MYAYVCFIRFHVGRVFMDPHSTTGAIGIVFDIGYCLVFLSFPLFGLLADIWVGRYRAITIGIIMCFLSWIFVGIGYIFNHFFQVELFLYIVYGFAYVFEVVGFNSFRANIFQYNIDQLVGASADELSSVIYCHFISIPLMLSILHLCQCIFNYQTLVLLSFIISGVSVSIVLVTHSLFKHWLENISLVDNPIKLIVRVLNYARKHKYPENRSALTYWEEEAPSRLDLGKEKYGGPFSEEEVEDVKTVFRMIPLLIAVVSLGCTDEVYWRIMSGQVPVYYFLSCLTILTSFACFTPLVLFVLYFIYPPCLHKYIPSMLKKIGLGLLFAVCSMATNTIILYIQFIVRDTSVLPNTASYWIVPQVLLGVSRTLIFPTSLELTIAQCPVKMRGAMVGMWYAAIGIGLLININLKYPFECDNDFICGNYYYYLTKTGIVLLILVVFVILAKYYKFRVRENEVNIHQIVDNHYQRYMEQEEQYKKDDTA